MRELSDELKTLSDLDELRTRAHDLREEGMAALNGIADVHVESWRGWRADAARDREGNPITTTPSWHGSGGFIEAALLVRVQNKSRKDSSEQQSPLIEKLKKLDLQRHLLQMGTGGESEMDETPVLLAARAMQALVPTATATFSTATLLCYYRIIREIYVADSPDWNAGGARAGAGGEVTAYVTGECIRAVLMFERSFKRTAEFFRATDKFSRYIGFLNSAQVVEPWKKVEAERAALEFYISMRRNKPHIALNLPQMEPGEEPFSLAQIEAYLTKLGEALHMEFNRALEDFKGAQDQIKGARDQENPAQIVSSGLSAAQKKELESRFNRSASAHSLAEKVIDDATKDTRQLCDWCLTSHAALGNLGKMATKFEAIAHGVQRLIEPAKRYVATVLDHELTLATPEQGVWDARELAFAAGAYGAITKPRKDERLVRACRLLMDRISADGFLPAGRPFHSAPSGLRWQTLHFEVCRALSELLQQVDVPVEAALIKQMLHPFEHMSMVIEATAREESPATDMFLADRPDPATRQRGWYMEDPPIPRRPTLWVSSHAVIALDKLVRMLDRKINEIILAYFSRKQPDKIEHALDELFYPDHGRALFHQARKGDDRNGPDQAEDSSESIGITLQRMRAHILRIDLPTAYPAPRFTAVLHGPPGTGKTTLLEALAKSSDVPLVQMSPSDIAVGGQDAIEARARTTFEALSMLTRVVIIFDEFEPVLKKRDDRELKKEGTNIYTFLTPGMLPKLTRLYEEARKKRVAYVLVTNHLEEIDRAAIRPGRFDHRVGIYMPDPVSRAGHFMHNLLRSIEALKLPESTRSRTLSDEERMRFMEVVRKSGGVSPGRLAQRYLKVFNAHPPGGGDFVLRENTKWKFPENAELDEPRHDGLHGRALNAWERALRVVDENGDGSSEALQTEILLTSEEAIAKAIAVDESFKKWMRRGRQGRPVD